MKILRIAILTLFVASTNLIAQNNNFDKLIKEADSLYKLKEYKESVNLYKEASKIKEYNLDRLFNASISASYINDKDFAFLNLNKLLDSLNTNVNKEWLDTTSDYINLHSDKRWKESEEIAEKYVKEREKNYNLELRDTILAMRKIDEYYQNRVDSFMQNFSKESKEYIEFSDKWNYVVDKNTKTVNNIINEYGFPGESLVGNFANVAMFFLIQHCSDTSLMAKCVPLYKESCEQGESQWGLYIYLKDRVLVNQGKKQLYGTQYNYNEEKKEYKLAPIEDIEHINERLAKLGLHPFIE